MMQRLLNRNRTFTRLILFNCSLVILITVIPALVYYRYFSTSYEEQTRKLNRQAVAQLRESFDERFLKEIIRIPNQNLSGMESNDVLTYPLANPIDRDVVRTLQVSNRVEEIRSSLPFVDTITIYYRLNQMMFQNFRACHMETTDCLTGPMKDWFQSFDRSDRNVEWAVLPNGRPEDAGGSRILLYARSIPYFSTENSKLGIIAVSLKENAFLSLLEDYKFSPDTVCLIVDGSGRLVTSTDREAPTLGGQGGVLETLASLGPKEEGMFSAEVGGRASVVSYSPPNTTTGAMCPSRRSRIITSSLTISAIFSSS
ncbi:cache domain-containing protein [Paenibacillus sp. CC-CFT747]|nr:cache domain-containing protein [Paenibacillus sp. CC-CFT747]